MCEMGGLYILRKNAGFFNTCWNVLQLFNPKIIIQDENVLI